MTQSADGMKWVRDLNLDDKNMKAPPAMQPGQRFVKGWRVRNSGTCAWDNTCRLVYVQGNVPAALMGGQPVPIHWQVAPGGEIDLQVSLEAPQQPGVYQGFWQMQNGQGQLFGERIWAGIQVPAPAAPEPQPRGAPMPSIQFWADRYQVAPGERAVLSWDVEGVREVYFYVQGQAWEAGGVTGKESREVFPAATTVYELRVVKLDGSVEVRQVRVEALLIAPSIAHFDVSPQGEIALGQCVNIAWDLRGRVDFVRLSVNGSSLWDNAPPRGAMQHCPPAGGAWAYLIEAAGAGGVVRDQRVVNVSAWARSTAVEALITRFSAEPERLRLRECVVFTWEYNAGGVKSARLTGNGQVLQSDLPPSGQARDCPGSAGTMVYRLEVLTQDDQALFRELIVPVTPA